MIPFYFGRRYYSFFKRLDTDIQGNKGTNCIISREAFIPTCSIGCFVFISQYFLNDFPDYKLDV